jgi:hypothetical protein
MDIIAVENKGWITGYQDGTFEPGKHLIRAEAVTLINRMLDRGIDPEYLPDWVVEYSDLTPSHWAYADIMEASVGHLYKRNEDNMEIWISMLPDEKAGSIPDA